MPKCRVCPLPATMKVGLTNVCSFEHAIEFSNRAIARKKARELKNERKELAERKKAIKPLSKWLQEAQIAFNAYIRTRDAGEPCISCGRYHTGKYNAGHFRTVAAASHLRFDERNVHKQCEPCNSHMSGNIINYRPRLIEKIGLAAVEALENDNTTKKWTIEEVRSIKAHYSALTKAIIK